MHQPVFFAFPVQAFSASEHPSFSTKARAGLAQSARKQATAAL
jgi:hypothetical protein